MPGIEPTTPDGVAEAVAELVLARPGRSRVLLDGPAPAAPEQLAEQVASRLRTAGRAALVVRAGDFLRPASVRLEYGREDPDEYLDGWLDEGALRREVLDPAAPDGSGRVLPRLWNPATDRAYRAGYEQLPASGVVLLAGALLLGRGLPADVTVHLHMGAAALARRLPAEEHWTLPAHTRYEDERSPDTAADLVALSDHPTRPALVRT
ncbi:uridine kinase [Pseudonocardia sp. CA-107938]|uniref:uridine kinase n=1 Tax=Pseudonocardia sp. CA-107938 TaxID=3240021 RepID=UPI003D927816